MQLIYGRSIRINDTISRDEFHCWQRKLGHSFVKRLFLGQLPNNHQPLCVGDPPYDSTQLRYCCENDQFAADLSFTAHKDFYELNVLVHLFNDQLCRHQVIDHYIQGKEQLIHE